MPESVDAPTVVALIVSLVALLVACAQVIQQYASTAYDYRRCSPRTVGGWAERTHRRWIWREVRFEITFSTPRITVYPRPSYYILDLLDDADRAKEVLQEHERRGLFSRGSSKQSTTRNGIQTSSSETKSPILEKKGSISEQSSAVAIPMTPPLEPLKQYCIKLASKKREPPPPTWHDKEDDPWFLQSDTTVPEAKVSWLTLLGDTRLTDLQVTLAERRGSYDFMPEGVTQPIASADRKSFLTLLSLLRVHWIDNGENGNLLGGGEICEVTCRSILNFGDVYLYHGRLQLDDISEKPIIPDHQYYIVSEKARFAMFHCFDLGFAIFRTQSSTEVRESLGHRSIHVPEDKITELCNWYDGNAGWSPGLSGSIACWADESMPKVVDKGKNWFLSIYSAIPARSIMAVPPVVAMLLGDDSSEDGTPSKSIDIQTLSFWAKHYFESFPSVKLKVYSGLEWAASRAKHGSNLIDPIIPWSISLICLRGVRELDNHLEDHILNGFTTDERNSIKSTMSDRQIVYGCSIYPDANDAVTEGGVWLDELDGIVSRNYVKIADDLMYKVKNRELTQMIVVNRLMRGALWSVHNGNAPDQNPEKRALECSLSSRWLADKSTVYIG